MIFIVNLETQSYSSLGYVSVKWDLLANWKLFVSYPIHLSWKCIVACMVHLEIVIFLDTLDDPCIRCKIGWVNFVISLAKGKVCDYFYTCGSEQPILSLLKICWSLVYFLSLSSQHFRATSCYYFQYVATWSSALLLALIVWVYQIFNRKTKTPRDCVHGRMKIVFNLAAKLNINP